MDTKVFSKEKRNIKLYFSLLFGVSIFTIVFLIFHGFFLTKISQLLSFLSFKCSTWTYDKKLQKEIILLFPPTVATITALIFAIPGIKDTKELPINKRTIILLYLLWQIPNIVYPLLLLGDVLPLNNYSFRWSIMLFIFSILLFVPYVLVFIHSSLSNILELWYKFAARPYVFCFKKIRKNTITITRSRITNMSQLTIDSIKSVDHATFLLGIGRLETLGMILLGCNSIETKSLNEMTKHIITNLRFIAAECVKQNLEGFLRVISPKMNNFIKFSMDSRNKKAKKIDYPIAILEMRKIGILCVENHMRYAASEIIEYLGQIGESSLNKNLENPPDLKALESIQKIGIECANRKLETLCMNALTRIQVIADTAKNKTKEIEDELQNMEVEQIGEDEQKEKAEELEREKDGVERVYRTALKRHWIVSAYLFKNVPDSKDWLENLRKEMKTYFDNDYILSFRNAAQDLESTFFGGEKILREYMNQDTNLFEDLREVCKVFCRPCKQFNKGCKYFGK